MDSFERILFPSTKVRVLWRVPEGAAGRSAFQSCTSVAKQRSWAERREDRLPRCISQGRICCQPTAIQSESASHLNRRRLDVCNFATQKQRLPLAIFIKKIQGNMWPRGWWEIKATVALHLCQHSLPLVLHRTSCLVQKAFQWDERVDNNNNWWVSHWVHHSSWQNKWRVTPVLHA